MRLPDGTNESNVTVSLLPYKAMYSWVQPTSTSKWHFLGCGPPREGQRGPEGARFFVILFLPQHHRVRGSPYNGSRKNGRPREFVPPPTRLFQLWAKQILEATASILKMVNIPTVSKANSILEVTASILKMVKLESSRGHY